VTCKAVRSNGTIELSQSTFQCAPEMQQDARAWGMDFPVRARTLRHD